MAAIPLTLLVVILSHFPASHAASFDFPSFGTADPDIALSDDAAIVGSAVRLARSGRVTYAKPVRFLGTNPGFSTTFAFSFTGAIVFSVAPNSTGYPVLSISYDVAGGIEIVIGGEEEVSVRSSNLFVFNCSGKLRSWIDYDGEAKRVDVRLSGLDDPRPANSSVSCTVDLSTMLWRDAMLVGISSRSGNSTSTTTVYSWDFASSHGDPYLMHSVPLDPYREPRGERTPVHLKRVRPWRILMALVFVATCGLLLAFTALLVLFVVFGVRPVAPVEYPEHPIECRDEKIVLVGEKAVDSNTK